MKKHDNNFSWFSKNNLKAAQAHRVPRLPQIKGKAKAFVKTVRNVHKYIQYQVWAARIEDWSAAESVSNLAALTGVCVIAAVILRSLYVVYVTDRLLN